MINGQFKSWNNVAENYEAFIKSFYDITPETCDINAIDNGINCLSTIANGDLSAPLVAFYDDRLKSLLNDLKKIRDGLISKDINRLSEIKFETLFNGCSGVGTNYFVFQHKLFK